MSISAIDQFQFAAEIKQRGRAIGFDLVGIAPATASKYRDYLRDWLETGQHGSMQYLANRFDERSDPANYFAGAKSVICVAMNYHVPLDPMPANHGRIARYALGDDYHELIKSRLFQLADWVRSQAADAQTRCAVDTAPVMEKDLSALAGVGWIGKNTCIINEQIGSWLLLGEILTTLELPFDEPAVDRCGTCTRCIDACPTDALSEPYKLDARKCISYLTIEHREDILTRFHAPIGAWLYGCDICQDVCPWNREPPTAVDGALQPRFSSGSLDVHDVMNWTDEQFRATLRNSAMRRIKLPQLKRNAQIVAGNIRGKRS